MKFTGVAAAPGIGQGPIYRLEREEFAVRESLVAENMIEAEIERFHNALVSARRDISRIRDGIAAELGEHEAGIYEAHLMIVDDPELTRAVEAGIRSTRHHAGYEFRRYMSGVAAHMESIEDEYLRERRADVLDVERRVLRLLTGNGPRAFASHGSPVVLVAHDIGPSEVALLDRTRILGFVTEVGTRTSHSAIVARGRGIPAVVGVRSVLQQVKAGDFGVIDGYAGSVEINPDEETQARYRERGRMFEAEEHALGGLREEPTCTLDNTRIELGANIELPGEVEQVLGAGADGVGLFRTEFFYLGRPELPLEEEQYAAYRSVAERLAPRPVIFRTMDLGGDKVASYLGTTHETNPFLGWRGIRLALHHPDVFRTQIRAIYRASAHGKVRIMFPMVSSEDEFLRANEMCHDVIAELGRAGIAHDPDLEVGAMVETPSAVWTADVLSRHAKFLSIGTNDLTQYTLAMDRDNERVAELYEPLHPAILRSIRHTVEAGHAAKRWVGVCGEMAGDFRNAVLLLGLGVDELSVSCFDLPRVKAAIRSVSAETAREIAREALAVTSGAAVRELLRKRVDPMLPDFLLADRKGV